MTTMIGPDGRHRCKRCSVAPEFLPYHDTEWGFPVKDDRRLFEKLCLETFQSGLNWRTILAKRDNFRSAFAGFDVAQVARFGRREVDGLLADEGIVRHRGKIEAVINNAQRARADPTEGSLADFMWRSKRTTTRPSGDLNYKFAKLGVGNQPFNGDAASELARSSPRAAPNAMPMPAPTARPMPMPKAG
jgi:DNA-3-methyladenine glycosylase I